MTAQRLLIAGSSGFIGQALLRSAGGMPEVEAIAGVRSANIAMLGGDTAIIDVTQPAALEAALVGMKPDIVVNAAAYGVQPGESDPARSQSVNVEGARNLLYAAAAAGCRRFVQLGSCSEYGAAEGRVREDMPVAPNTAYGTAKAAATALVRREAATLGVDALILRLFNVWGEGEAPHRLFPAIVAACRAGRPLDLTDCTQVKNYSYVGDFATWLLGLSVQSAPFAGRIVNLASAENRPLRDFVLDIAGHLGGADLMRFGAKPRRAEEALAQVPDLTSLDSLLPGRRITPLREALHRVLAQRPGQSREFT